MTARADWNSSSPLMRSRSLEFAGNDTALAKSQYESAMKRFVLATTRTIRELRPGCVLSWENYPLAPMPHVSNYAWTEYCAEHPGTCWNFNAPGDGEGIGYLGPGAAAQRAINDGLGYMWDAVDAITGAVYLNLGAETDVTNTSAYLRSTAAEQVRLCAASRARGGRCRSVMPIQWLHYDDLADDNNDLQLMSPEDVAAALVAPLEGGGWCGLLGRARRQPLGPRPGQCARTQQVPGRGRGTDRGWHLPKLHLLPVLPVVFSKTDAGA